jgi:exosome complex exonuclease RRP6
MDQITESKEKNDEFIRAFMSSVAQFSKQSNVLPVGSDFAYFKSCSKEFSALNKSASLSTAELIGQVIHFANPQSNNTFEIPDDLADSALYDQVVDAIDLLLDQADRHLDNVEAPDHAINKSLKTSLYIDKQRILISQVADIDKPQEQFLQDIDNSRERSFKPKLKEKHFATAGPLDLTLRPISQTSLSSGSKIAQEPGLDGSNSGRPGGDDGSANTSVIGPSNYYPHPYEKELMKFNIETYNPNFLKAPVNVEVPSPQTPFQFVDTVEALCVCVDEILLCVNKEIAVDLEHHSYRSFLGLTCVMQVPWPILNKSMSYLRRKLTHRFQAEQRTMW